MSKEIWMRQGNDQEFQCTHTHSSKAQRMNSHTERIGCVHWRRTKRMREAAGSCWLRWFYFRKKRHTQKRELSRIWHTCHISPLHRVISVSWHLWSSRTPAFAPFWFNYHGLRFVCTALYAVDRAQYAIKDHVQSVPAAGSSAPLRSASHISSAGWSQLSPHCCAVKI